MSTKGLPGCARRFPTLVLPEPGMPMRADVRHLAGDVLLDGLATSPRRGSGPGRVRWHRTPAPRAWQGRSRREGPGALRQGRCPCGRGCRPRRVRRAGAGATRGPRRQPGTRDSLGTCPQAWCSRRVRCRSGIRRASRRCRLRFGRWWKRRRPPPRGRNERPCWHRQSPARRRHALERTSFAATPARAQKRPSIHEKPRTSVFSAKTEPSWRLTSVFATPSASTRGLLSSASSAASRLYGMVTLMPSQGIVRMKSATSLVGLELVERVGPAPESAGGSGATSCGRACGPEARSTRPSTERHPWR